MAQARGMYPRPTNAQALAALDAFGAPPLPAEGFEVWQGPSGVMPRFRVTAAGWVNPGDRVRDASDAAWWRARYKYGSELWAHLAEQARLADAFLASTGDGVVPVFDAQLAAGDPSALAHELTVVTDQLASIYESNTQDSPPYLWGSAGIPFPNPKRIAEAFCKRYPDKCKDPKKLPLPLVPKPTIPWWVVLGLVYLIVKD